MTPRTFTGGTPGLIWPAHLDGLPADILALHHQLDASQWWEPARLRAAQLRQLHALLAHAARHVPFYRARLRQAGFDAARPLDEATWARLPVLTRTDVQTRGARLHATRLDPARGDLLAFASGGSTGIAVRVRRDAAQQRFQDANALRLHTWHCHDPAWSFARFAPPGANLSPQDAHSVQHGDGIRHATHGRPAAWLWETGPAHILSPHQPIPAQIAFLRRTAPDIVVTQPANLNLILAHLRDEPTPLVGVRAAWTSGGPVDTGLRTLCEQVLGCPIVADYTANETGFMAIQCPDHPPGQPCAHVCAETVFMEILDDDGRPCPPGQPGRVIVTPLHGVAMPLLRYEIGDIAAWAPACPCGRGLPSLAPVSGRTTDLLTLEDGTRRHTMLGYTLAELRPVREYQVVQTAPGVVEARLVASRRLTEAEASWAKDALLARLGPGIALTFAYRSTLPRTKAGKLKPFVSEL